MPTNLSLWMRVPSIVAQLIMGRHGQYVDVRLAENASSVGGKGESDNKSSYTTKTHNIQSRYSVLPTLSLDEGVLHCDIIEGAFNTGTFLKLIEHTLDYMQPFPAPNSVLMMDNCRIHKHPTIKSLIETR